MGRCGFLGGAGRYPGFQVILIDYCPNSEWGRRGLPGVVVSPVGPWWLGPWSSVLGCFIIVPYSILYEIIRLTTALGRRVRATGGSQ